MARALQDPLGTIRALMTDNDVSFGVGDDDTAYSFQLQPVYAFDFPDQGFSFIPRAIIPILGVPGEADLLKLGEPRTPGGTQWGMGDIQTQFFFAPKTKSRWKFGLGPQLSWRTRTNSRLGGPDWGAGPVGVLVGDLTEHISSALIVGNLWSYNGDFNSLFVQPMVYYNFESVPGMYLAYNNTLGADWKADKGSDTWTVPLGLTLGRTFDIGDYGLDLGAGPYYFVASPDGGPRWQIKFSVTLLAF